MKNHAASAVLSLLMLCLGVCSAAFGSPDPTDARGYYDRGMAKHAKGDLAGATGDYRHALSLNPKFADAYYNLAQIELDQGNYQEAEANLSHAIELEPGNPQDWYERANARYRQGHDAEGAKDLAHVITLPAQSAQAYINRGDAQNMLGRPAEAASDYRRALGLGDNRPRMFYRLAFFEAQQHRFAQALDDAQRSLRQPAGKDADYPNFLAWILQARLGDQRRADERLTAYLATRPRTADGEWAGNIGAFLLGRESEEALLAHASSGDPKKIDGQHCEAWYYAGIKRLVAGDKAGATACFRKCVVTKKNLYTEYTLARSEVQTE